MTTKPPSLRCRLWGHDLNVEASHYYGMDFCERCDTAVDGRVGLREWIKVRAYLICRWFLESGWSFRHWLKCSECGHRFGRHDPRFDHIPF